MSTLQQQNQEHPSPDFRQLIRLLSVNRLWLLSSVLIALSLAIVVQVIEKRKFNSTVVLSYSNSKVSPLVGVSGFKTDDDFLPKMNALIEESRGVESCQKLIAEVSKVPLAQIGIRDFNPESVCGSVQITPDYDKMQVLLKVESLHPVLAQLTADAASIALVELDRDNMSRKIRTVKKFLSAQEAMLGKQLRQLEDEKTQYQAQTSVISIDQAEHSVYESLGKSEQDYFDYEVKLKANESLIRQTQDSIAELTKSMTSTQSTSNLFMNQMQYRLSMLKYRRAMLGSAETPESKKIDEEISSILEKYREALRDGDKLQASSDPLQYLQTLQNSVKTLKKDNVQLKKQITALEANLKNKSTQIRSLASSIQRLGELSREIEVTTSLYMAVKKRLQEVDIEMAATVSDLSILRPASIGLPENTPLLRKMLFAIAITLFMNITFFLGRDMFVPTIKDVKEFESFGISAVGYTPLVHISPLKKMPILLREFPDSTEADAFRALRLRIMNLSSTLKKPGKALVVLVTSPLPSSGKTFVSSNLAYAFAKSGVKTLLVDFDLRHPSISKFFETSESTANLDKFFERSEIDDCIINQGENLDIVRCSNLAASPADHLEKLILNQFIEKAAEKYEMILMDSPPVLSVIDPFLVAPHASLNLLVVEYRKTHKEDILNSVRQLSILEDTPTVGLINCVLPEMISGDGGAYYRTVHRQDRKDISA